MEMWDKNLGFDEAVDLQSGCISKSPMTKVLQFQTNISQKVMKLVDFSDDSSFFKTTDLAKPKMLTEGWFQHKIVANLLKFILKQPLYPVAGKFCCNHLGFK